MTDDLGELLELDPRLDTGANRAPTFRYAIFSQQRSGSAWLCRRLINLAVFGVPAEYLNARLFFQLARRLGCPTTMVDGRERVLMTTYLQAVEGARTSTSGRFGIKIQPNQLFPMFQGNQELAVKFLHYYDALIVLTCRDRLRQAISGAIARATGRWGSDGQDPDVSRIDREKLLQEIAIKIVRYTEESKRMAAVARATGRPVLPLAYEQMLADPDGTLDEVVRFLGHREGSSGLSTVNLIEVPSPRPGRVSAEIRQRFLDYIEGRDLPERPMPDALDARKNLATYSDRIPSALDWTRPED